MSERRAAALPELCAVAPALELGRTCLLAAFSAPSSSSPSLLQVARLQALYAIRVRESLVCLGCTVESDRSSSMLTLPVSLFDMDSKPLKTLVRGPCGEFSVPAQPRDSGAPFLL